MTEFSKRNLLKNVYIVQCLMYSKILHGNIILNFNGNLKGL